MAEIAERLRDWPGRIVATAVTETAGMGGIGSVGLGKTSWGGGTGRVGSGATD